MKKFQNQNLVEKCATDILNRQISFKNEN